MDLVGKRLQALPQLRIVGLWIAALPAAGAIRSDYRFGILAERGGERLLEAGLDSERRKHRTARPLKRSGQRLMLRQSGGMRGFRGRQHAFRLVAPFDRCGARLLRRCEPGLGLGSRGFGRLCPLVCRIARFDLRISQVCSAELRAKPGALVLDPRKLRTRRVERSFRHPPLGPHRRLPSHQVGKPRLGFAGAGFQFGKFGCEPG